MPDQTADRRSDLQLDELLGFREPLPADAFVLNVMHRVQHERRSRKLILLIFGLVFLVVGLAFKLGVVPFHMWIPDVYQGAPVATTLFIASVPKMAAFAMAFRLLQTGLGELHTPSVADLFVATMSRGAS